VESGLSSAADCPGRRLSVTRGSRRAGRGERPREALRLGATAALALRGACGSGRRCGAVNLCGLWGALQMCTGESPGCDVQLFLNRPAEGP